MNEKLNDEFLKNYQESPSHEFSERLYQRIMMKEEIRLNRKRLLQPVFALLVIFLVLGVAFTPAGRVYARQLFEQIGRLFITHEPTYAEQMESALQSGEMDLELSADSIPVEWQEVSLLSLEEAADQAGFDVYEIGDVPEGFEIIARYVFLPEEESLFTKVSTNYKQGGTILVFNQTLYGEGISESKLPVGDALVSEVEVQGTKGLWIENLRLSTWIEEDQVVPQYASLLVWEKDGFEFWLQSTPGLELEEMLNMANSVEP